MASLCVRNTNPHPLHHRHGIQMWQKTDSTNCRLSVKPFSQQSGLQTLLVPFKHRRNPTFSASAHRPKPICHSQPPSSTLHCLLGHRLSCNVAHLDSAACMWSPNALLHPAKSLMVFFLQYWKHFAKQKKSNGHITKAHPTSSMPTSNYAANIQNDSFHADVLPSNNPNKAHPPLL